MEYVGSNVKYRRCFPSFSNLPWIGRCGRNVFTLHKVAGRCRRRTAPPGSCRFRSCASWFGTVGSDLTISNRTNPLRKRLCGEFRSYGPVRFGTQTEAFTKCNLSVLNSRRSDRKQARDGRVQRSILLLDGWATRLTSMHDRTVYVRHYRCRYCARLRDGRLHDGRRSDRLAHSPFGIRDDRRSGVRRVHSDDADQGAERPDQRNSEMPERLAISTSSRTTICSNCSTICCAPRGAMGYWRSTRTSRIRTKAKSLINIRSWPPIITWWSLSAAPGAGARRHGQARAIGGAVGSRVARSSKKSIMRRLWPCRKRADAMPGFGIVAAVLGIVVTMGAIDGPAEEIGEKVGAALVGTFLGILISYGFLGPMCRRMEFIGKSETRFLQDNRLHHSGVLQRSAPQGGHRTRPPRRGQRIAPEPRGIGSAV